MSELNVSEIISLVGILINNVVLVSISVFTIKPVIEKSIRKTDLQDYEMKVNAYKNKKYKELALTFNKTSTEIQVIAIKYIKSVDTGKQMSYEVIDERVANIKRELESQITP